MISLSNKLEGDNEVERLPSKTSETVEKVSTIVHFNIILFVLLLEKSDQRHIHRIVLDMVGVSIYGDFAAAMSYRLLVRKISKIHCVTSLLLAGSSRQRVRCK